MKRSLVVAMASILMVCLMASCGGGVENGVETGVDTYTNTDEAISIGVNREFVVALDSNPTTGYQWEASYDESMFELVERTYKAGEQTGGGIMVGTGGVDYLRFKALRSGEAKITLVYRRPWEITIGEQRVFRIDVD
jgi:inhibitor of cysteine peptidase